MRDGTTSLVEQLNRKNAIAVGRYIQALAAGSRLNVGAVDRDAAVAAVTKRLGVASRVVEALKATSVHPLSYQIEKGAVVPASTSDGEWAGPLAPQVALGTELVELMRGLTAFGRLNVRAVPFNVKFARVTTGVAASFVGESQPIPAAKLALDVPALGIAKVALIVPITAELAAHASPQAAATIAADCASAFAVGLDNAFLDPDRAAVAGVSPASITYGATQIESGGTDATSIVADAKTAMNALVDVPLTGCTWIMSQPLFVHLSTMLQGTTNAPVFPDLADNGRWLAGLSVLVSGSAYGAKSATESILALVHGPSIAVADSGTVLVDVSIGAAIEMDTTPSGGAQTLTSLYQNDLVGVRCTRYCNWTRRRDGAVVTVRGINL